MRGRRTRRPRRVCVCEAECQGGHLRLRRSLRRGPRPGYGDEHLAVELLGVVEEEQAAEEADGLEGARGERRSGIGGNGGGGGGGGGGAGDSKERFNHLCMIEHGRVGRVSGCGCACVHWRLCCSTPATES